MVPEVGRLVFENPHLFAHLAPCIERGVLVSISFSWSNNAGTSRGRIVSAGSSSDKIAQTMKKLFRASSWMWDHRGQNIWWRPPVLTASGNPADPSNPQLNLVEATSVFKTLENQKLIFPVQHPVDKKTAYLINEVREKEWKTFLRGMSFWWRFTARPLVWIGRNVAAAIFWLISIVIASAGGAFFGEWMKKLFSK
jgi:hypothetical protein